MDSAKKRRLFRLGVVVLAALLVEVISIIQYERVKTAMEDEMDARARVRWAPRSGTCWSLRKPP